MSKQSREERIAAGWTGHWIVRADNGNYTNGDREWGGGMWNADRKVAFRFGAYGDAADWISWFCGHSIVTDHDSFRIRRLWTRKKPKAPPPLKVGDEVMVRAKVIYVDQYWTGLRCESAATFSVRPVDVIR